jgi:hypothetical protein
MKGLFFFVGLKLQVDVSPFQITHLVELLKQIHIRFRKTQYG